MKFNKMFTYGMADAIFDKENGLSRRWNSDGICKRSIGLGLKVGEKHFSSEYISGYTSIWEFNQYK